MISDWNSTRSGGWISASEDSDEKRDLRDIMSLYHHTRTLTVEDLELMTSPSARFYQAELARKMAL